MHVRRKLALNCDWLGNWEELFTHIEDDHREVSRIGNIVPDLHYTLLITATCGDCHGMQSLQLIPPTASSSHVPCQQQHLWLQAHDVKDVGTWFISQKQKLDIFYLVQLGTCLWIWLPYTEIALTWTGLCVWKIWIQLLMIMPFEFTPLYPKCSNFNRKAFSLLYHCSGFLLILP